MVMQHGVEYSGNGQGMGVLDDNASKNKFAYQHYKEQAGDIPWYYEAPNYDYTKGQNLAYGQVEQGVGQQTESRTNQQKLIEALQAQAAGKGPSLVQEQLKAGTDRANALASSMAASQRGINPVLAARMATQAQGQNTMAAASQAAQLKAQEQLSAQQQLANAIQAQRSGDLGQMQGWREMYGTSGGLGMQQNQLGLQAASEQAKVAYQNQQLYLAKKQLELQQAQEERAQMGQEWGMGQDIASGVGGLVEGYNRRVIISS